MELTQGSSTETTFMLATDAAPGLGGGRLRQVSLAVCCPGAGRPREDIGTSDVGVGSLGMVSAAVAGDAAAVECAEFEVRDLYACRGELGTERFAVGFQRRDDGAFDAVER